MDSDSGESLRAVYQPAGMFDLFDSNKTAFTQFRSPSSVHPVPAHGRHRRHPKRGGLGRTG